MDELVKYLTSKMGYTLAIIFGFGVPGNVLIFMWNRELYLEMDIFKLLIISFGIPFMLFIPNLILVIEMMILRSHFSKKEDESLNLDITIGTALVFNVIEIGFIIALKINNSDFTVANCWKIVIGAIVFCSIAFIVIETIVSKIIKIKNKRKK